MDNQFKFSDLDHPLYEYSQVITEQDLLAFQKALTKAYRETPWYQAIRKWATGVAIGVMMGLVTWIRDGKNAIKET